MTVPSLLRHVGINVPRYVTVNGSIVTGQNGIAPSSVTALEPHRFHGGEDHSPVRNDYAHAWWNTDQVARDADMQAMAQSFPGFNLNTDGGDYSYHGIIDTGRGKFGVLLLPQVDHSLPSAVPAPHPKLGKRVGRVWRDAPHLYLTGNLCIAGVSDWDPARHTTATACAWAAHWYAAYTEWRMSNNSWPSEGYGRVA